MKKKNFLFVSWDGYINDTAWQVYQEGHRVKFYIKNKTQQDLGDGFVPKITNWQQEIDWADIIIFDDTLGQGKLAQRLRKKGKLVIGGTPYTDRLEDDRAFGQEEMKKFGINILPYQSFTSLDKAIQFVKKNPAPYVIKPSGDDPVNKRLLFVGEEENGKDVLLMLQSYKKTWSKQIQTLQIQRKVIGVEIGVGGFFNGHKFVEPININFEHKKLFNGNLGPETGEMGTSMFWSMPNKIFNETLKKLENKLKEENYVGHIDINCIVNQSGIFPLEFTCRFGYPTIFIHQEGINLPISEFFYRLASGEDFVFPFKKGFQVGTRVVVPPYPFNRGQGSFDLYSKNATIIFKKLDTSGVHIEDVKKVGQQWLVTGSLGVVLTVVGTGATMEQAKKQSQAKIKNILIPNMYYRTDIGDGWLKDGQKLKQWGYLKLDERRKK